MKFSDAIFRLLYPFLVAHNGNATTVSDVFCLFVVYMYTKHVTYQLRIVSFYNYSRTHLFVSFVSSRRLLSLCNILVAPYWGWNTTDKMIHADYYIYVELLRGSLRISECFGDKDCVMLFHGNTRCKLKYKHIQNIENILSYGRNRK